MLLVPLFLTFFMQLFYFAQRENLFCHVLNLGHIGGPTHELQLFYPYAHKS